MTKHGQILINAKKLDFNSKLNTLLGILSTSTRCFASLQKNLKQKPHS